MYEFKIISADEVIIGDIVTMAVGNDASPRGIHWTGKVLEIHHPHEDITEFRVHLLAHCKGDTGIKHLGARHERQVAVIRLKGAK
jgi:hypothetical protein